MSSAGRLRPRFIWVVLLVALALWALGARSSIVVDEPDADGPLDERWDPTGSHPLPNESVDQAP